MLALADEPRSAVYSAGYRARHDLPGPSSIGIALQALERKEIAGRSRGGRPHARRAVPRGVATPRAASPALGRDRGGQCRPARSRPRGRARRRPGRTASRRTQRSRSSARLDRERRPVRPRRGHRVEGVGDREQPRLERDRAAAHPGRVAPAVPPLVMEEHVGKRGCAARIGSTSSAPARGWRRISASSSSVERPRLAEHVAADRDLADVVQRRAEAQRRDPFVDPSRAAVPRARRARRRGRRDPESGRAPRARGRSPPACPREVPRSAAIPSRGSEPVFEPLLAEVEREPADEGDARRRRRRVQRRTS